MLGPAILSLVERLSTLQRFIIIYQQYEEMEVEVYPFVKGLLLLRGQRLLSQVFTFSLPKFGFKIFSELIIAIIIIGAIEFRSPGRTTPLNNTISVGNGSDVVIAITCLNTDGGTYNWQYINGSNVPDPLMAFGISQDMATGVLRIYPAPLIEQDGSNMFTCISNRTNDTITLILCK